MKRISLAWCLLLILGGAAHGGQNVGRGTEEFGPRLDGGVDGPALGEHRPGPPPEAFRVCAGKSEGSMAQFTNPDGETITGTCRVADGRLVLRPDHPRGNSPGERRGPPPEAFSACVGKSAGSTAQFIGPRGETVKGTCEDEGGKLVLRPEHRRGERPRQFTEGAGPVAER